MFKTTLLVLTSLSLLTSANPVPPSQISQCNTGDAQCCNTVQSANDPSVASMLGLLGIAVQGVTGQVGLGCTPVSVIGAGQGANCAQQPVCCQGNNFNGLVTVGCTPISL